MHSPGFTRSGGELTRETQRVSIQKCQSSFTEGFRTINNSGKKKMR